MYRLLQLAIVFDVGKLLGGKRKRPYDTVFPVSEDLNLTVDVSCDRDDEECVANTIDSYEGGGNILIRYVSPTSTLRGL